MSQHGETSLCPVFNKHQLQIFSKSEKPEPDVINYNIKILEESAVCLVTVERMCPLYSVHDKNRKYNFRGAKRCPHTQNKTRILVSNNV